MVGAVMKRSMQWDIKGAVGLAGIFHFFICFASGCLLPFLTLYLRHLGLTAAMTGVIMAVKHLVALVWRPISSSLARRHNKRRVFLIGSVICSSMAAMTLLLFPPIGVNRESERCNVSQQNDNQTVHVFDFTSPGPQTKTFSVPVVNSTIVNSAFNMVSEYRPALTVSSTSTSSTQSPSETRTVDAGSNATSTQVDLETKTMQNPTPERSRRSLKRRKEKQETDVAHPGFLASLKVMDAQHQMFFLVMIVVGVWMVISAPLEWIADDGLHEYLDFVDATDRHTMVKPWRLLGIAGGMGSTGILVYLLYCVIGPVLHIYAYAIFMVIMVPVAAVLPLYRHKRERLPGSGLKALQLVRGDSRALLCAISALLSGMASSTLSDFLLWQMQDHGASELQMGIALALAPLCQAVFAPLNRIASHFLKSHGRLLLLAISGLCVQCLYFSFLWAPWAAIPAQLLAGLSSGALWWSIEAQCVDIASPGTEKAVYRVFEALFLDLGAGLGSLAGGFVVQTFGVGVLFQGAAVMLALWCVALAVLQWRIPRQRRINYSRLLAADASEVSESESDQDNDWLEKAMEEDKGNNNKSRKLGK
ncbi:major facilitator superfamily domain-containing protein 6-like [Hoplias malabaricus]|uniref:major facilitator superfamily domain-containing protein 6-like n=1 Tax=Hoplias malabaricus TaxID=27720 RepID=UPI003462B4EE